LLTIPTRPSSSITCASWVPNSGIDDELLHTIPAAQKEPLGGRVRHDPIRPPHLCHVEIRPAVTIEVGPLQRVRVKQPVVQHFGTA